MSVLERIRESRWRYGPPWAMTLSRPVLGGAATYEIWHDHPWSALGLMVLAQASDTDGWVARKLHATSRAGEIADPATDTVLRVETAATLAPIINPIMGIAALAAEATNLALNAKLQKGAISNGAIVPTEAKEGTVIQSVGASMVMLGEAAGKPTLTALGGVSVAAGSMRRTAGYIRLYTNGGHRQKTV